MFLAEVSPPRVTLSLDCVIAGTISSPEYSNVFSANSGFATPALFITKSYVLSVAVLSGHLYLSVSFNDTVTVYLPAFVCTLPDTVYASLSLSV